MFELNEDIINLFDKFVRGELHGEELRNFNQMLADNPEIQEEFKLFLMAERMIEESGSVELKKKLQKLQRKHHLTRGKYAWITSRNLIVISSILLTGFLSWLIIGQFAPDTDSCKQRTEKISQTNPNKNIYTPEKKGNTSSANVINNENAQNLSARTENNLSEKLNNSLNPLSENMGQNQSGKSISTQSAKDGSSVYRSAEEPLAGFYASATKGCVPFEAGFYDSSYISGGSIVRYLWDFGDGTTSTLKNPVHQYTRNGIYSVKLTVWSNENIKSELLKKNYITVNPSPQAEFSADPFVTSLNDARITFTNTSKYTTNKTKYLWKFGDNHGQSSQKNPVYSYSDTGSFNVVLMVINEYGCSSTSSRKIVILGGTDVFIPTAFSPDGQGPSENNLYRVVATGFDKFLIQIVSRNGELLYESTDYATHGWNGNRFASSEPMPAGVYVVKVTVTGLDGRKYNFSKGITLIR